jgi:beta-galactosamide-alpha-2,3-sialyltransferase
MNKSLILLRTPLQAYLVEKILNIEKIQEYDILYITTNNSEEDINYFNKLKNSSKNSKYIFIKKSKFSLIYYIKLYFKAYKWISRKADLIFVSSIDLYLFRTILKNRDSGTKIITFDDGIENFKKNGNYNFETEKLKLKIYQIIFNFEFLDYVKKSISYHYTLNDNHVNIIEEKRVKKLKLWPKDHNIKRSNEQIKFFISEPFHEFMTQNQIKRINLYLKNLDIDYYVKHPREEILINDEIKLLNKNGCIAEEAIINISGNKEIILIGWISSVMLNLAQVVKHRIVFLLQEDENDQLLIIAKKSGCEIIYI